MGDVLSFKCPCCKAPLTFSSQTGEMTCEYCGSSFTIEQAKAAEEAEKENAQSSDMTWASQAPSMIKDENGKVTGYRCPSCSAEMVADENTAATECPYCGNQAIIPESFEGMYKPDLVIPFKVSKEEAQGKLKDFTKGKKLLPKSFTSGNRIENITGLYVPFWLYSCHAQGNVSFEGIKSKTWDDSNYNYVKKDFYNVVRRGEMDFENIPVDASTQMDDSTMDSLEPFDMSTAVDYDAAYFSGYLASRYDVTEKDAQPRANERVKTSFKNKMHSEVLGYDEVREKSDNIHLTDAKAQYAMFPVWMMTTKYEGKSYTFGINGQSGRMVGSLPVDMGKYFKYLAICSLICFLIMQVFLYIFGNGMTFEGEAIALVLSVIIGWIYAAILKSAMSNIAKKTEAGNYLNNNSYKKGPGVDSFLYSKTEKTQKQK